MRGARARRSVGSSLPTPLFFRYGVAPEHTKKTPPKAHAAEGGAGGEKKAARTAWACGALPLLSERGASLCQAVDIRKMDLEELEAEVYRRKSQMEEKEVSVDGERASGEGLSTRGESCPRCPPQVAMLDRKNERRLEKILGSPDGKQTGEGGEAGQGVSAAAPVKAQRSPEGRPAEASTATGGVVGGRLRSSEGGLPESPPPFTRLAPGSNRWSSLRRSAGSSCPRALSGRLFLRRRSSSPGGQLMSKGVNVENYPGLDGESGGEIIRLMKRQALKFSTTFADDWVTSVDLSVRPFVINTNGSALTAPSAVLAAGACARHVHATSETRPGRRTRSCSRPGRTRAGWAWRARRTSRAGASRRAPPATVSAPPPLGGWG